MTRLCSIWSRTGFHSKRLASRAILPIGIFVGIVACNETAQKQSNTSDITEQTAVTHTTPEQDKGHAPGILDGRSMLPSKPKFGVKLYAMNCGEIQISDLDAFSMTGDYAGQSATYTNTCYLVDHPAGKLLWDIGLPAALASGAPLSNGIFTLSLKKTLVQHLKSIALKPDDIDYIAISHSHFDHIGQASDFAGAIWLANAAEVEYMVDRANAPDAAEALNVLLNMQQLDAGIEEDVFGDGSVIVFQTPGHTPGHMSLQVMLDEAGPVLLTGDVYHRIESRKKQRIPRFNTDVEETRASMATFEARAAKLGATVVIQHDIESVSQLPVFPTPLQ